MDRLIAIDLPAAAESNPTTTQQLVVLQPAASQQPGPPQSVRATTTATTVIPGTLYSFVLRGAAAACDPSLLFLLRHQRSIYCGLLVVAAGADELSPQPPAKNAGRSAHIANRVWVSRIAESQA